MARADRLVGIGDGPFGDFGMRLSSEQNGGSSPISHNTQSDGWIPRRTWSLLLVFLIILSMFSPLLTIPPVSADTFTDTSDADFAAGYHENTENVGNAVRLLSGYTQGRFTSRTFDPLLISDWDNLKWNVSLPSLPKFENDNVGAEPATLVDGDARTGVQGNDFTATHVFDGSYEQFSENGPGQTWTQTGWGGENVAPAQVITCLLYTSPSPRD